MVSASGPVILDLIGKEFTAEERELLQHPLVGGVILFTRNFENREQITRLCQSIRESRTEPLLIAVDQEGGRVQRFRQDFTRLPPVSEFGKLYEQNADEALVQAEKHGYTLATELSNVGVDLSFAPVLDLNKELNTVIGDRSFHRDPSIVIELGKALMRGMHKAGMAATGKHFPGHGSVTLDSHLAIPVDEREWQEIKDQDLIPFVNLIDSGIDALMPAHIIFPKIDDQPVGFSEQWLKNILRKQLKFSGVIFSDDLNMEGASTAGDYANRAQAALTAGCDFVLICNNRVGAINILDHLPKHHAVSREKIKKLQAKFRNKR